MTNSASRSGKFMLAVGLQLAIIIAIVISKLGILAGGTEVLLRIEPVDPRDLLRGDYVTFRYSISRLDSGLFEDGPAREGETVYVVLGRSGETWDAVRVLKRKPDAGHIFIKGKMRGPWFGRRNAGQVVYGIEQYFIPEGAGASLGWSQNDRVAARVAVDEQGNAVIKGILINGEPWP